MDKLKLNNGCALGHMRGEDEMDEEKNTDGLCCVSQLQTERTNDTLWPLLILHLLLHLLVLIVLIDLCPGLVRLKFKLE